MKCRQKSVLVDAVQGNQNGDHPQDNCFRSYEDTGLVPTEAREGDAVRYFSHPYLGNNDDDVSPGDTRQTSPK